MKKLILMCAMLTMLACLCACSLAPTDVSVDVSCDEFQQSQHMSREVEVPVGASLKVTLCANPTTGFEWEEASISDPAVLEQVGREFVGPESEPPPPPGTPGQEVWTFKTLKTGESTMSVDYSRPWEGGEKGEWSFVLTAAVK
jgi:inhibitor of cysteine peptidase